jgi:hypothetical protein
MRNSTIIVSVLAAAALLTANEVFAADLNLMCKSELTNSDGTQQDFLRKYEITFGTKEVRIFDNLGNGFTPAVNVNFESANNMVIVISNRGGIYHMIDRVTGMAFSKNANLGHLRRGICSLVQETSGG